MAKQEKSGFRWAKEPKPEALAKLLPEVREGTAKRLIELAPSITRQIVERLYRGQLARDGKLAAMPQYSPKYKRLLERAGQYDNPDLRVTNTLLDHLGAKLRILNVQSVELRIAPYGRVKDSTAYLQALADKNRPETYTRAGYTYTNKSGHTVSVPPTTIQNKPRPLSKKQEEYRRKAPTYNAHLATYLSMRLGYGKWASGGKPPSSFLTLTANELGEIQASIYGDVATPVCAQIIQELAGK